MPVLNWKRHDESLLAIMSSAYYHYCQLLLNQLFLWFPQVRSSPCHNDTSVNNTSLGFPSALKDWIRSSPLVLQGGILVYFVVNNHYCCVCLGTKKRLSVYGEHRLMQMNVEHGRWNGCVVHVCIVGKSKQQDGRDGNATQRVLQCAVSTGIPSHWAPPGRHRDVGRWRQWGPLEHRTSSDAAGEVVWWSAAATTAAAVC